MDYAYQNPLSLLLAVTTTIAVVAGCSDGSIPATMPEHVQVASRGDAAEGSDWKPPLGQHDADLPMLRFQVDESRERVWVLVPDGVHLYSRRTGTRIARVPLPDWSWAGEPFSCAPALAVGRNGEALVSSDVMPVVWRIDPATLRVTRHDLALDADADKDVGFSGMAFAAGEGGYYAVSRAHGSMWRIDSTLTRAQKIPLSSPVRGACALSVLPRVSEVTPKLSVDLCARTVQAGRVVHLAPDQRSGHVSSRACTG